ncbi:MAG: TadE/TadG family type IV pilus assembly protein [Bryobacteraceae bacterium]
MRSHYGFKGNQRGSVLVEFLLTFPFLFLLFLGVYDFGFYLYASIAVQDAARTAALYTSDTSTAGDVTGACQYVLAALQSLPNRAQALADCSSLPVQLTAAAIANGPDGNPTSQVTLSYQTIPLIAIPGLPGQLTITRTAQMRVRK